MGKYDRFEWKKHNQKIAQGMIGILMFTHFFKGGDYSKIMMVWSLLTTPEMCCYLVLLKKELSTERSSIQ